MHRARVVDQQVALGVARQRGAEIGGLFGGAQVGQVHGQLLQLRVLGARVRGQLGISRRASVIRRVPGLASWRAMAAPMPREAPVRMATV